MNIKLLEGLKSFLLGKNKSKKRAFAVAIALFVVVVAGALFLLRGENAKKTLSIPKIEYTKVFSLTSDKISQSANIAISIPPNFNVGKEDAKKGIEIYPEIKGVWIESGKPDKIVFQPEEKMKMGRYYSVVLKIEDKTIGSDFLVVDDPEVLTVFPKADSETPEESEITVMFNRPMVPITTLDVLSSFDIPLEITPETKGKFKWIGSRTLQFIPDERLIRSSNYYVKVKPEFVSLDGLGIKAFEQKFTTRALRYEYLTDGISIYNSPISIKFNQPVDLERTAKEIELTDSTSGKQAEFIAEYGWSYVYNKEAKKNEKVTDNSSIFVYNKSDQFGREKLWDFKNNYHLKINRAYPAEGDIMLAEPREVNIQVTDIISSISATSERTSFSKPEFFDPQGKLWVQFYEDIDLGSSDITATKKVSLDYGKKCKDDGSGASGAESADCEKVTDKKKIYFSFDYNNIKNYDILKVNFRSVVNMEGLKLNDSPIIKDVNVISDLKILSTIPADAGSGASLSEFIICSNSPISVVSSEDASSRIKANLEFEFKNWQQPVLVPENYSWEYYKCKPGEFESRINYRLIPESSYEIEISASDHFSRVTSIKRKFKTGTIPEYFLNFYHYQKNHNVTTPDKTKLTYAVENMDFVDMNICKIDPEDLLYFMSKRELSYTEPAPSGICNQVVKKRIDLGKKYWVKNYFKVDIRDYFEDPMGHYVLTFSNPNYKEEWGSGRMVYERTYLTVTNLGIVEKKVEVSDSSYGNGNITDKQKEDLKNVYWITDLKSLSPIEGAKVQLFSDVNNAGLKKELSYQTNASGVAETSVVDDLSGAIVTSGKDSAVISGTNYYDKFQYGSTARQAQKIYLYTDKPIYKPGQDVNIKGLYRIGYDGNYEIFKDEKVPLKIYNSKGEEIFKQELEVSDYGTFDAKTIIDTKAPLGTYRIDAKGSSAYFDVEEYVPAPFKVETTINKEEYISGDKLDMDVDASYYFGAPLQGGEVEYSVVSQNYYFDKYNDEYFNFGIPWYYCYEGCDYGNKFISRNTISLNDSGKAKISYDLNLKKMLKDETDVKSKIIVFYVTVKNKNGQSVSAQRSFIVHNGEYYLGVKTDKYFFGKNENFEAKVKSVDTNGKNISVENISLKINKASWVQSKRKEVDGGYYNNWERKLDLVSEKKISTDQSGNWKASLSLEEEGEYELTVSGFDSRGNAITSTSDVYVYGEAQVSVRRSNDESLELITEKNNLKVGEEAEIIIKSPYGKAKALISIERGKIFDYKIVDVDQNLYNYKFSVSPEYAPNFFVSAILVSSNPEVKFGKLDFQVGTEKKELNISAKTNKTEYLPGEDVVLDFESKDYQGNPAETEFSVAVVDLSVLALKGNPKKNPIVFFYGGFPLTISTSSNIKNILYEVNVPGETKGGGGAGPEDLAKKKRGEFKDTAFWQAVVRTDAGGKAQVKFTLPDNLTTWQVESVGITKDTKLGVGYSEFLSRKDVMVVPLKPRFVIPGDKFSLGAKIFNQTGERQDLEVKFTSESLALENDQSVKSISLGPKESKTVYFSLLSDLYKQDGYHSFVISAKNNKFEDTVEDTIKITRNDTYETTATSGYSKNSNVNEFVYLPDNITKDRGDLTIKSSATLAIFISDALNYLLSYPYGCSEQIASKLDSIAVVKRGLNIKNIGDKFELKNIEFDGNEYTVDEVVEIGLARLYQNQKSDGSFGYYPDSQSNIYLTLHVAGTLKSLKDAGYAVNEDVLSRAFALINNRLSYDTELQKNRDFVILAFDTLSKLSEYGKINNNLYNYIKSFSSDEAYLNEEISNTSLTTLAGILVEKENVFGKYYKDKAFNILENRIDIDSRGAFLPPAKNSTWQYYATPIKDTAMLLKVLVSGKRDNEILDRILRWLLRSRSKDGAWGSTNNTLSVIDSLTDYINWQKENESNFDLKILLDGKEKQAYSFSPETILSQNSLSVPVADLAFGSISNIEFEKKNNNELNNNFYYDISLKYYLPIDQIPPRDEGFTITREFYRLDDKENKNPVSEAGVGEVLRGHIKVLAPAQRNFVSVEDFIPAGSELVNFNLATEDQSLITESGASVEDVLGSEDYYWWSYYNDKKLHPDMVEFRDDRLFLFKESLSEGEYEYDYYIRVLIPGTFHHLPAVVSEMYFPENFGRTRGNYFEVK